MQSKRPSELVRLRLENKNGRREYWPILNRDKIKIIQNKIGRDTLEQTLSIRNAYGFITKCVDQCVCHINKSVKEESKKKQKVTKGEIILLFALIITLWTFVGIEAAVITSMLGFVTSLLMHTRR